LKRIEAELRERERQLNTLVANIPGIAYRCRNDRRWTEEFVGGAVESITGLDREAFASNQVSWADITHPEDREMVWNSVQESLQHKRPYQLEYRILHCDGSVHWVWEQGEGVRDEEGNVVALEGFILDITQRKRVEDSLRESEERFRAMSDHLPLIVWVHDAQGRQEFVNQTFCEYFGVTREEMRADRWRLLTHPEDESGYAAEFLRCVREQRDFHATVRVRAADGNWHWLESWGRPRFGSNGQFLGHVGTSLDITERRQIEQRLAELFQRLNKLMDNTPLGVVEWDANFSVTRWSGQAERMFGWSADEMVGRGIEATELFFEADKAKVEAAVRDLLDPEKAFVTFRNRNNTKFGDVISCEWYNSVLRDETGRMVAVLSLVLDVTERERALEALREGDRRKDEFLAVLAHELRNPLAPIRNGLELLRLTNDNSTAAEQARAMMERQVEHMVRLIDDLLDVSRIARGKLEVRKQPVDVAEAVLSALESSRPLLAGARHEVRIDLPREPLMVEGDLVRLAQVFVNLLNNAARYTPPGGNVAVSARKEGDEVVVAVQDDGVGIPEDMIERVFEPFVQIERQSQGGLGLGLALSRSLVAMHHGSIKAHGRSGGRGTCFTVRLPAKVSGELHAAVPRTAGGTARTVRVLVVDDNRDAAQSLGMLLQMLGHEVDTVTDGANALEVAASRRPHIVILDIGMPGMDGYEVVRRLRLQPTMRTTTIVALTGYGQEADRRKSAEAGFDAHLVKPVERSALEALIEALPMQ
jgi:PAS domain S-box-containing protein